MRPVPLLTLLLTMTLVAASVCRGAEAPGCTPVPLHPSSPAPPHPRTECTPPAADMPPAPDGCPDYAPIAPPAAPIPPPCLTIWVSRSYWDVGTAVALHIDIDHPELSTTASTYTKLSKLIRPGEQWELVDADWEVSCGKDEAPLVWALFEILNEGQWEALDIYTSSLPEGYVAVLRELASLRNFTYLPYLEVQQ